MRKAEVRNCNESKVMQKSIEKCYKQHQQTIKNIEKEKTQLIQRSIMRRLTNNNATSKRITKGKKERSHTLNNTKEHPKLRNYHSNFSFLHGKNEVSGQLPKLVINSDVIPKNQALLHYLASPKFAKKKYDGANSYLLDKNLSRSLGNLDSLTAIQPRFQSLQQRQRHVSTESISDLSVKLPSFNETLVEQKLTRSISYESNLKNNNHHGNLEAPRYLRTQFSVDGIQQLSNSNLAPPIDRSYRS